MDNTQTIIQKLVKIQGEIIAPKNQRNNFGKYNYRSCEDIIEAVKPLLAKYEVVLTLNDALVVREGRHYIEATAMLTASNGTITTTAYAREPESKKGMDESQITGAASSYARKYALNGLLAIDDTKDADTQDNTNHNQYPNGQEKPPVATERNERAKKPVCPDCRTTGAFHSPVCSNKK